MALVRLAPHAAPGAVAVLARSAARAWHARTTRLAGGLGRRNPLGAIGPDGDLYVTLEPRNVVRFDPPAPSAHERNAAGSRPAGAVGAVRGPGAKLHRRMAMRQRLLNALVFFPSRAVPDACAVPDLALEELSFDTEDGERLNGWWAPARSRRRGHVLLCHGNGGDIGDRIPHARLLTMAGFAVLLFDYRGYGRSSGRPTEAGTYRDARAAHAALLRRATDDPVFYLGESLGGAVALALALERPPAGLILQSAFTSIRDMARLHYPHLPQAVVPDAYPNLARIRDLRTPLLILHGERDAVVPASHGEALFDAAPPPKRIRVFPHAGHNDLITRAGEQWVETIAGWAEHDTHASAHA